MTDRAKKITELTAASSASANDLLIAVTNTSTNAVTKSITVGNFFSNVTANAKFSNTVTFTSNVSIAGALTVNNSVVIAANGTWVGSVSGMKGDVGEKGSVGATGNKGDTGAKGEYGEKGATGLTGSIGAKGDKGDKGITGDNGPVGAQGTKGDKGAPGADGGNGFNGNDGTDGDKGDKGDKGDLGAKGEQGIWGGQTFSYSYRSDTTNTDPGLGGIKFNSHTGASVTTVYIDHVDLTLHPTHDYLHLFDTITTSSIRGHFTLTEKANTRNFGIFAITGDHIDHPNGGVGWAEFPVQMISGPTDWSGMPDATQVWASFTMTGDVGDKGAKGDKGDTGSTGSAGAKGDKGDTGSTGSAGAKGDKGDTGSAGAKGDKGAKGDEGGLGATGAKGEPGTKGDTGAGTKGDKGDASSGVTMPANTDFEVTTSSNTVTNHLYTNVTDFVTDAVIPPGVLISGWSQRNSEQIEVDLFIDEQSSMYSFMLTLTVGRIAVITYSTTGGNQTFTSTVGQVFTSTGQVDPTTGWARLAGRVQGTLPADQTGIVSVNFPTYTNVDHTFVLGANGTFVFPDATAQSTAFTGTVDRLTAGSNNVVLQSNGKLSLPTHTVNNSVYTTGNIEVANAGIKVNLIPTNSHTSPPLANATFSFGVDGFTVPDAVRFGSDATYGYVVGDPAGLRMYSSNNTILRVGDGAYEWKFTANGAVVPPTLNVDLHNGGVQQAQTLQFADPTQQAIITGPTPASDANAQRLIIQGQRGLGTGEGGDVYVWGGDSEVNGGDIKIYAGDADNSGSGGYVNIDGGRGPSVGGDVAITGGYSQGGSGGDVIITGGGGANGGAILITAGQTEGAGNDGGNLTLVAGYGQNNGGVTTIRGGGSAAGLANYGNVLVEAGSSQWNFAANGSLVTPGSIIVADITNAPTASDAAGTQGEIRIDGDYIYVCVATDTWKRSALSTW